MIQCYLPRAAVGQRAQCWLLPSFVLKLLSLCLDCYYDWATAQTTLTTQFAGGNPPDLPYLTTAMWPQFASQGALLDLTDRVHADDYKDQFVHTFEALWKAGTYQGKIYGCSPIRRSGSRTI